MKKRLFLVILLLAIFAISASAQTIDELYEEQVEASGGRELLESLPQETRELIEKLGINFLDKEDSSQENTGAVLDTLWDILLRVAKQPLKIMAIMLAIVLVNAWIGGLHTSLGTEQNVSSFAMIASLVGCSVILLPVTDCITNVAATTESLSVFMMSFAPVYAGVLLTTGHAATAVSFQSMVLYAAQLLSLLSSGVIVPLMSISLSLGLVGSLAPEMRLNKLGELISKNAVWMLSLGTMLFVGVLSLQNLTGAATDTLGNRAIRFSIASFVPVVGGSISEAFSTIRGCLSMLRTTLGVLGVGATALLVIPPLCTCFVWNLCLSFCRMSAEMFEQQALTTLFQSIQTVLKCLIAILAAGALFAIIAITVVTLALNGS